ncbi:hypothetical protein [Parasphingorhabdus sp.]|uniref:hypothetical protein n=1 Tax=Parasphingorhabdus sp. TaxID=2709688 RepID=UPI003A8CC6FF
MRLIGVGLLAFLLAGVLVLLGQGGAFRAGWNKVTGAEKQQFSDYQGAEERGSDTSGTNVFSPGQYSDTPLILSGMPSYTGQLFRLPIDSRPTSGRYGLVFSSRVSEGVEGVLRVSINGMKRADILLNQSKVEQKVEIELTPTELSSPVLDVSLSLQGRGPIAQCSIADSIAAVVEIKPESGLRLSLAKPVNSTRDRLALWGDRVPVLWNEKKRNADDLTKIVHAARLVQKGYSLHFGKNGLDSAALSTLSGEAKNNAGSYVTAAYPIPITGRNINSGIRKFDHQTSWRYHYNVKNLPGQTLPSALDMRMAVGPTGNDARYDLTVTLNDHILFSRRLSAQTERINQSIALPAGFHQSDNKMEISLATTDANLNLCGAETPSVAELLPETVLRGGGEKISDNLSFVRTQLHAADTVALLGETDTAVDAQAIAQLLGLLDPRGLSFVKGKMPTNIRILAGDIAAAIVEKRARPTDWIIYRSLDRNIGIVVQRVREIDTLNAPAVALLVSLSDNGTDNNMSGNAG